LQTAVGLTLILYSVVAWLDKADRSLALLLAMMFGLGFLGIFAFLETLWLRRWPRLTKARFGRARFLLGYFRSLSSVDRFIEFCLYLVVLALCGRAFYGDFLARTEPWESWLVMMLSVVLLGVWTFLVARHAALLLLSLVPIRQREPIEGTQRGA
jgi:hypothetical protein